MKNIINFFDNVSDYQLVKHILRGTTWNFIGSFLSRVLNMITTIILARTIGKNYLGELNSVTNTILMFSGFSCFGIDITLTKYISEFRNKDKNATSEIITSAFFLIFFSIFFVSFIFLLIIPILENKIFLSHKMDNILYISIFLIIFNSLNIIQTSILIGFEEFKLNSNINLFSNLISSGITLLIIKIISNKIIFIIMGMCLTSIIQLILNFIFMHKIFKKNSIKINIINFKKYFIPIINFSIPAFLSTMIPLFVNWYTLTDLIKISFSQVSYFNISNQWKTIILFFPTSLSVVILPILSNIFNDSGKKKTYKSILIYNLIFNTIVSSTIAFTIILFSKYILNIYGKEFIDAKNTLIILSLSSIIFSITNIVGQAIISIGKMWFGLILNLLWGIVMILLYSHFSYLGSVGLSLSNLVAYLFHFFTSLIILIYLLKKEKLLFTEYN